MRDSNSIKKDEKHIPHFRRIVPYSEWGRNTRREGGGTTFPARRAPYPTFEHDAPSERVLPLPLKTESRASLQRTKLKAIFGDPDEAGLRQMI